ncbi:Ig-like domain-containing protein [Alloalcanivorax marinus]|uniref:Ig-like domain-containing protein n=1 Tax=Alloalcanivorax marinus TaxID=1177169 RepID=UPI001931589C|nr:Ig-like domain-containing protein [Alloalcanivorax marinus]MBL7250213.1 Ig-like domain-containing protein [Alloalcanivorax marinus]
MIRKIMPVALALPTAVMLAACGGGSSSPSGSAGEAAQNALTYSYPIQDQHEVPTPTPVVLRFSQSIEGQGLENDVVLRQGGQAVDTDSRLTADGRSLILTPTGKLDYHADYVVEFPDDTDITGVQDIRFSTRAAEEGIKANVITADTMDVTRAMPSGGEQDPMMDFSTIRLQFTQPLEEKTLVYGQGGDSTVRLLDRNGDLVPAWMVVDGPYLTIDPKEDLTAGQSYRLAFEDGAIESIYGESFAFPNGNRFRFNPASSLAEGTSPDQRPLPLVQRITTPGDQGAGNGLSPLTGEEINKIPVNAVLLGDAETTNMAATQQEGDLLGDLAFLPDWPTVSPLRIRRGTLLTGSSIDVKIGGEVDAGFDSGEVRVHFLSDANGYLIPNIYDPEGPRMVRLFMDVAMSTEDAIANGGVTQNITHLELVGTVSTDTDAGVIDINAVGVVEPMILGQERGYGTLSFQLQTYRDQTEQLVEDVRQQQNDTTPPTLQSWMADQTSPEMPVDESGDALSWFQAPSEPIVLNFDEPLSAESLREPGALSMTRDGAPVEMTFTVDGAAVVIQPEEELRYTAKEDNPEYQIQLGSQITDLAGNNFVPETLTFKLPGEVTTRRVHNNQGEYPEQEDVQTNSPMVLSAYPGYPCVLDSADRDLANGFVGRCAGGPGDWPNEEYPVNALKQDDNLPLMTLPANRPIVLQFTKAIDPASVSLGGSFNVVRVDETGQPIDGETVPGSLTVEGQRITFVPDEPWMDGQYYSYTLGSNNRADNPADGFGQNRIDQFIGSKEAVCDGSESICGKDGLPLRTQPLGITRREPIEVDDGGGLVRLVADSKIMNSYYVPNAGGPDMVIFFKGASASDDVLQTLRTSPDVDTNGNLIHDAENMVGKLSPVVPSTADFYDTEGRVASNVTTRPDGTYPTVMYPFEEAVPNVPDPNADPVYDPEGVQGLPNSAKILSLNTRGTEPPEIPWYAEGANPAVDLFGFYGYSALTSVDGANVGCGYNEVYDPETGETGYQDVALVDPMTVIANISANRYPQSEPTLCPEKKFTYLKMGLNASVGQYDEEKEAIKVEIYPSQSISTSFVTYARNAIIGIPTLIVSSGEQIMRMRYAKDDPLCEDDAQSAPCARTKPITAWIKEGSDGPILAAEVDLYIDAPILGPNLGNSTFNMSHTLHSYEVTMSLTGPVSFLDDGRMIVQQRNENPLDIDMQVYFVRPDGNSQVNGAPAGRIPYRIPVDGVFLQMISEPIKKME